MELIDNVGLHRTDVEPRNAWMATLVAALKAQSNTQFVVRLTTEKRAGGRLIYVLANNQNKTSVQIAADTDGFVASLHERALPDPEMGFKPPVVQLKARSFSDHDLEEASAFIAAHLDKNTPYSLNTVVRIKVTPTANPLEAWTFAGGRITTMQTDDAGVHLTVEDGKQTYFIPHVKLLGASNRPAVYKCVLFNENGDFEFLSSGDFDAYFVMKNVS